MMKIKSSRFVSSVPLFLYSIVSISEPALVWQKSIRWKRPRPLNKGVGKTHFI
jgi:hypothetical protein